MSALVPLLVWVYLSCSPAWFIFVSLFVAVEELSISLLAGVTLTTVVPTHLCQRRFHFADDISKPPALPSDTKILFKMKPKARIPSQS